VDGILNVDKPFGLTSFGVVSRIRKLTGERSVGHAGTLDPMATGVLPVLLGQATRLVEYLATASKIYRADIELGVDTDTYDAQGSVVGRSDISQLTLAQIEAALIPFRGDILQVPPMYSALKHGGRPLYRLAREGQEITRSPRPVTVYHLDMVSWVPPVLTVIAECSKGTYIRSLAHDLGQSLGCGACLCGLVRQRYGGFDIDAAVGLDTIEKALATGDFAGLLYPPDSVLGDLPAVVAGPETARQISCGVAVAFPGVPIGTGKLRVYDSEGYFMAILAYDAGGCIWRPRKVFHGEVICHGGCAGNCGKPEETAGLPLAGQKYPFTV
jgi:tRNA pseudouridine55 synthase